MKQDSRTFGTFVAIALVETITDTRATVERWDEDVWRAAIHPTSDLRKSGPRDTHADGRAIE
jgi:hypothetical protein